MKKTLSMLAVLGIITVFAQASEAAWSDSNWNPSNWFGRGCNKCEKKVDKCNPCSTGYAAPCNPCQNQVIQQPCPCQKSSPCPVQKTCDPCDKLQNMSR